VSLFCRPEVACPSHAAVISGYHSTPPHLPGDDQKTPHRRPRQSLARCPCCQPTPRPHATELYLRRSRTRITSGTKERAMSPSQSSANSNASAVKCGNAWMLAVAAPKAAKRWLPEWGIDTAPVGAMYAARTFRAAWYSKPVGMLCSPSGRNPPPAVGGGSKRGTNHGHGQRGIWAKRCLLRQFGAVPTGGQNQCRRLHRR